MRAITFALAVVFGITGHVSFAADEGAFHVAQASRVFHPAAPRYWRGARTEGLATRIWFPVDSAVPEQPHDSGPLGNPIFKGHPLSAGATLTAQRDRFPLVVMSHGTGGNADSMDWIAAELAASGYIVAAVDHPGNTAMEPMTWDGFTLWWERAKDLSNVLDALLADAEFGAHIDEERIGALGFSIGGYTVLALAGARTNVAAFRAFCAGPEADAICHPPEMSRVVDRPEPDAALSDAAKASLAHAADSFRDPRIKAVFAIAPAVGQAFDTRSFADVKIPVTLTAGAADITVPLSTNVEHVAHLLPAASLKLIPGAGHYSFLPVCMPEGFERLPMLCRENAGVDRMAIHATAVAEARHFFDRALNRQ